MVAMEEAEEEQENSSSAYHSRAKWQDTLKVMQLWVRAIHGLPPEAMKFALNTALETLATNHNLHVWGKKSSPTCTLCSGHQQSLLHVLNTCPKAMELRQYSRRHNAVLFSLREFVTTHLPPTFTIITDLPEEQYSFPPVHHSLKHEA